MYYNIFSVAFIIWKITSKKKTFYKYRKVPLFCIRAIRPLLHAGGDTLFRHLSQIFSLCCLNMWSAKNAIKADSMAIPAS